VLDGAIFTIGKLYFCMRQSNHTCFA
jgi:hypothetical protein